MYAVIQEGGKQYHVREGNVIQVERLEGEIGSKVSLSKVLAIGAEVGSPYIEGAKVEAEIISQGKTDKVIVFKKKRRQNYRRKRGHRQNVTTLRVLKVASK